MLCLILWSDLGTRNSFFSYVSNVRFWPILYRASARVVRLEIGHVKLFHELFNWIWKRWLLNHRCGAITAGVEMMARRGKEPCKGGWWKNSFKGHGFGGRLMGVEIVSGRGGSRRQKKQFTMQSWLVPWPWLWYPFATHVHRQFRKTMSKFM